MYEVCKTSIQRKIEKGTINGYRESLTKKVGTLYFYGALTEDEYGQLMDLLASDRSQPVNEPEKVM